MVQRGAVVHAAKAATSTIPIVLAIAPTPSSRTGRQPRKARRQRHRADHFATELNGKRLELLKEAFPGCRVALLWNPLPASRPIIAREEAARRRCSG